VVVEDFSFDTPKTKEFIALRKNLNLEGKRSLLVLPDYNDNIYLSSRNIPQSEVTVVADLNTYSILKAKNLVLVESSVELFGNLNNA